jgi:PKD repeat protein
VTHSKYASLDGKTGALMVEKPLPGNYGPVHPQDTFYLRYADGTRYHQFGTTCYAWVHQPEMLQQQTLATLAASPFNKIRFCVFPKSYAYNTNEPPFFAFAKRADGSFDFNRPDPAFWRHFENRILDLQKLGIEADLILWHPYDRWGFSEMSDVQDDAYLRYCIARLSAYRNVWWSLANEFDFMTDQPPGHRGNKQLDDWDRFFSILSTEDPNQRMRGIHNGRVWYDHTKGWVTHASLQTSDMKGGVRFRQQYQKPVIYDECKYEGDVPQGWGNLTGREMTQRFWLGTMSGCYVGHGETYLNDNDILWWSKGGVLHGESPPRIAWLKEFMKSAPPFEQLKPVGNDEGQFILAGPGDYHLLYVPAGKSQSIVFDDTRPYKVDAIDPWEMQVWPVGTADGGKYAAAKGKADLVYRFVPYSKGEKMRVEAEPTASATEGIAPLRVTFSSPTGDQALWDFDDGSKSNDRNPTHTFVKPGIYSVSLSVKDALGEGSRKQLLIYVDRESSESIVRAGFRDDERPPLKLQGTAKRAKGGAIHLPDGKPYGLVKVDDQAIEDLRGLRSFTISGWVKPESLKTGSGGNRIVYCLQKDHSGIDLVCHVDGRLRLSVNEWPDRVNNDSSPGRLVTGKWTFFAVTYDVNKAAHNVAWYFSSPVAEPSDSAEIKFDRRTTYNVGPVATDIGPVAIGNFNDTMKGFGLDRQFRGQIARLQIFGSRIGGRGAMELDDIQKHLTGERAAEPTRRKDRTR